MSRRILMALGAILIGGLAFIGFSGATFTDTTRTTTTAEAAPDWTPPVVEMVDPGSQVVGTTTVSANAYDATSPVTGVTIQYVSSGLSTWSTLCADSVSPYSCSWDTTLLADDVYDLRAVATDSEGNTQTSEVVSTEVVNTGRVVDLDTIPSPVRGTVSLSATFYGNGTRTVNMRFQYWTGSAWNDLPGCGPVNGNPQTCNVDTTLVPDGSRDIRVLAVYRNNNYFDEQDGVVVDNTAPAVTIDQASDQVDPSGQETIRYTVVFSEPVTGFGSGDVSLSGSGLTGASTATVTGSGSTYEVAVTNTGSSGTVIADIGANAAQDSAGNTSAASTSTDNSVTRDTVAPTVTIDQAAGQADPTSGSAISFTVVFSKPVTGFATGDVTLSGTAGGSQVGTVSGSGTTYNVTVTGVLGDGTVVADVASGVALDAAGNANAGATSTDNSVRVDQSAPTVTVEQASGQDDPARLPPIDFTVEFSEPVTGFTAADVTTTSGNPTFTGSGTTYNVAVSSMDQGDLTVSVPAAGVVDEAGNGNSASTNLDDTVTFDSVRPRVTINQAAGQSDPTNSAPVYFTVVFDEPVAGFETGDLDFGPSTALGPMNDTVLPNGDGMTFTVSVSGMTGDGTVVPVLDAGAATDAAGNTNVAATFTDRTVTLDTTKPTVTIDQAAGQSDPTNGSPVNFTVVFSKPVTGFETGDVTLSGTSGGPQLATVTGSGSTYNVAVNGMSGDGTVVAIVAADVATDAAGNTNVASTSTDNTVRFDAVAPTVTINQASGQVDPSNGSPINFRVVFSEPVTGFATGDVSLTGTAGGPMVGAVSGSGTTYNVAVTGMSGDGTVIATLAGGEAQDLSGNVNVTSTSTDNTVRYDGVAPTVTINQASGQVDPSNGSPINFAVVFNEAVSGFDAVDVTLGGSVTGTVTVTGSGTTYNVAVSALSGQGPLTATIGANRAIDLAGNFNAASTSTDNSVTRDTIAPTVTINQASGQVDPSNGSPINFAVVFNEAVSGFDAVDVTLGGSVTGTVTVTGSGTTYNVAVSALSGQGPLTATIGANRAIDLAGNFNAASTSTDNSVTRDTIAPSVTIDQASGQADPTNGSTINFTVVFSEAVTGFATGDVTLSGTAGGPLVGAVTGSGTTYNVAVTGMSGQGTVNATIAGSVATDSAGNNNAASTSTDNSVTRDTIAPTVTINQAAAQADPTPTPTINFTVVFNEAVTGFATGDVTIGGTTSGTKVGTVTGSGTTYNVAVTGMTSNGIVTASIAGSVAVDQAGNNNAASTSTDNSVTLDTASPLVTINQAAAQADPTNGSTINFTVVFNEAVTGFTTGDVTLGGTTGGTKVGTVTGSGTTYNVAVTGMTGEGTVTATVGAGVATDGAGNGNAASSSSDNTVTRDTVGPSVTIEQAAAQADPTNGSTINFTVVFSEAVTGFATGDVTLGGTTGGTKVGTVTGSGTTYNVAVTGMTGEGTVTATVGAGVAIDLANNNNAASSSTDNSVTRDTVGPSVTINQAAAQADPTNGSTINFTVVFSEPVTGFATGDVTVGGTTGGTKVGTVTGSGTTYNVAVTGMTGNGTVVATIAGSVATDQAGNNTAASTSTDGTVTYDGVAPTVTINQAAAQADPTKVSPINFTVVFSEAVTGFATGDVTVGGTTGGTKVGTVTGSGTTYNVAVTGMTGNGTVVATIAGSVATDAVGNNNAASTSTDNTVTYDGAPSVTIEQATGQADPTNGSTINFTVVFNETVTGFATGDVTITGTTTGTKTAAVTGSGTTYNVAVTGMTSGGTVIANIAAGVAIDATSNTNTASTSTDNTVTRDVTAPTVTINQAAGQADPTKASPINFTVVFSEPVIGFATGDVTIAGTAGGTKVGTVTGSGTTYNVAVTGMTGNGTVVPTIVAGRATDPAGNGNTASTRTDNTVTYDGAPSVTINQAAAQADPTNGSTINFTVVFNETVTGFATGDVTLGGTTGGTKVGTVTGSGTTYNVAVTGMTGNGTVTASIAAGVAIDATSNPNTASTSTDSAVTRDVTAPTVTINQAAAQADPYVGATINFTVVFSETVIGFATGDVTITGTAGGAKTATVTGSGTTYNVAVTGMSGSLGTVIATIAGLVATDAVGNGNAASTSTDNTVTWNGP